MQKSEPVPGQRNGQRPLLDRRRRPTPALSRFWLRGRRRRGGRRPGEAQGVYVDRYSRSEMALVGWLIAASGLDLALTLHHISLGGGEANPVMDFFLTHFGPTGFASAKALMTISAALFLLIHSRFRGTFRALALLSLMYAGVMAIHVVAALDRMHVTMP